MENPKKEERISIKIDSEMYRNFQAWCKENGTNVSAALRMYIKKTLDEDRERKLKLAEREKQLQET